MYMVKLFETQPYNKNLKINLDIPISELSEYKHYISWKLYRRRFTNPNYPDPSAKLGVDKHFQILSCPTT